MPGTVYHLWFAKRTLERLKESGFYKISETDYMAGNLLPDSAADKAAAHCYTRTMGSPFLVPDMVATGRLLMGITNSSLKLGITAHYFLDRIFTLRFLSPRFTVIPGTDMVIPRGVKNEYIDTQWSLKKFFSFSGLYYAYSHYNQRSLQAANMGLSWIKNCVPYELPLTGVEILDARSDSNWYKLLERRLKTNHHNYDLAKPYISWWELQDFMYWVIDLFVYANSSQLDYQYDQCYLAKLREQL